MSEEGPSTVRKRPASKAAAKSKPAAKPKAKAKSKAKSKAKAQKGQEKDKTKKVKNDKTKAPTAKKPAAAPKMCPRKALTESWRNLASSQDAPEEFTEGQEAGEEEEPTMDPECEAEEPRDRCKVAKLRSMQLKGTVPKAVEELLASCKGRAAKTKVVNALFLRDKKGHLQLKMPDPKLGVTKAALSSEVFNDTKKGLGPILFKAKFNLSDVQLQEA